MQFFETLQSKTIGTKEHYLPFLSTIFWAVFSGFKNEYISNSLKGKSLHTFIKHVSPNLI